MTLKWSGLPNATYEFCWDTINNGTCDATWQSTGATALKVITNLAPGTYYWQARATTASGTAVADAGLWWSFTVVAGGFMKLGPAPGLTVGSSVTLQWTPLPDSGYWVCWDTTNNDSCDGMWWPNGGGAAKPLDGLAPGTYYWQVRAQTPNGMLDGDGGTWWSFTVSGSGGFVKLGPMNGVSGLTGDVNLQWSSVPDSGYWVCWDQIDNGQCDTAWWPNGGGTIRQLAGLTPGTYYWQAKVWNGTSTWEGDGGVWWAFTVGTPVITFGKQTPAAGAVLTTNAATFTWTTVEGASFYEFCLDTVNNGVCDTSWQTTAQATTKMLTGLTDGVYYWQVRAQTAPGTTQADVGAWWTLTVDAPDPVREYVYLGNTLLATITLTTGTPVVSYYHTDVLGSVRAVTDAAGVTLARHDYFPFGESASPMTGDPRRFTGKERDPETAFDYFEARYYRNVWGRFTSVDPGHADRDLGRPQSWNAYSYVRANPLRFTDPTGLSTHTDWDGNVVAVYNDHDLGVYRHASLADWDGEATLPTSGKGVVRMGETAFWDEFADQDRKGRSLERPRRGGARIEFGASWDDFIERYAYLASLLTVDQVVWESRSSRLFDIKANQLVAPWGPNMGRLLDGKYATAESAGNFLYGYNMERQGTARWFTMLGAGAYAAATSGALPLPPYWGETEYAGRQIDAGYDHRKGRRR